MRNLKKKMLIDTENRLVVARGHGWGELFLFCYFSLNKSNLNFLKELQTVLISNNNLKKKMKIGKSEQICLQLKTCLREKKNGEVCQ